MYIYANLRATKLSLSHSHFSSNLFFISFRNCLLRQRKTSLWNLRCFRGSILPSIFNPIINAKSVGPNSTIKFPISISKHFLSKELLWSFFDIITKSCPWNCKSYGISNKCPNSDSITSLSLLWDGFSLTFFSHRMRCLLEARTPNLVLHFSET